MDHWRQSTPKSKNGLRDRTKRALKQRPKGPSLLFARLKIEDTARGQETPPPAMLYLHQRGIALLAPTSPSTLGKYQNHIEGAPSWSKDRGTDKIRTEV